MNKILTTLKTLSTLVGTSFLLSLIFAMNSEAQAKKYTAVTVVDTGGLGDGSFNDGAYAGMLLAKSKMGITVHATPSKKQNDYVPNLEGAVNDNNANFVLGVGFLMADAIKEVAANYPKTQFAIVDFDMSKSKLKNLTGITYKTEEAGYLAGIVAANMTYKYHNKSKKLNAKKVIGAVLGMKIPPVETYVAGYIAGAHSVDPTIKVLTTNLDSFTDQSKGKAATDALISKGADIIFQVAGKAGLGAINSAKQHGVLAIGVDVDQAHIAPNTILFSAEKDISSSVFQTIQMSYAGKKLPHNLEFSLANKGVKISGFHKLSKIIPADVNNQVKKATADIIHHKIKIPTTIPK